MPDISITYRNTSELIPYARNSRTHSEAQVAQIAGSIREFGFANPVLIDGENGIIAGHGRLLAAQKLNIDTIPCIVLDHLTKAQQRALVIADNKLAMNAGWDNEMLSLELGELKGLDVDLELIGFSAEELAAIGGATVEEVEFPGLPDGEKEPFQQMTFTLHDEQAEQVAFAISTAKSLGPFIDTGNENSNGNAIARVCELFNGQHGHS